jgi:hypothetical protein
LVVRSLLPAAVLAIGACAAADVAAQQLCNGHRSVPSERFQDNGDGTVTDLQLKLMWMRCAAGQQWQGQRCLGSAQVYAWADARRHAEQLSRDGSGFFNDWRVPALRELATIADRGCSDPRTNLDVFPGTPAAPFWSSTPRGGDASVPRAMALSFGEEGVMVARTDERFHLRLVRTGP